MTQNVDIQRLVISMEANFKKYERALHKNNAQTNRQLKGLENRYKKAGVNIGNSLSGPLASIGALLGVREIQRFADTWTATSNRLVAVGIETENLSRLQGELVDMAVRTRTEYSGIVDLYAKVTRSSKELGITQKEVAEFTETTAKAFKIGGASASEQAAGILQLGQALASGTLKGDEYRSISENATVFAKALADYYGVTIGELKNLSSQGKITSADMVAAMKKATPEIEAAYGKTVATMADAVTNLKTITIQAVGEIDRIVGVSIRVVEAVDRISDSIGKATEQMSKTDRIAKGTASLDDYKTAILATKQRIDEMNNLRQNGSYWDWFKQAVFGATVPLVNVKRHLADLIELQDKALSQSQLRGGFFDIEEVSKNVEQAKSQFASLKDFRSDFFADVSGIGGDDWKQAFFINDADIDREKERSAQIASVRSELIADANSQAMAAWDKEDKAAQAAIANQKAAVNDLVTDGLDKMTDALQDGKLEWKELGAIALEMAPKILAALGGQGGNSSNIMGGLATIGSFFGEQSSGLLAGIFHDGGIAGSPKSSRAVSPGVFVGAQRYHGGGVAGLKPNEVPAILEKGEVIIPNGTAVSGGQTVKNYYYTSDNRISIDARNADRGVVIHLRNELRQLQSAFAGQASRKNRFS